MKVGYRGISVKRAVYDPIDRFLRDHPELGYNSTSDFFVKAAVARFRELQASTPAVPDEAPPVPPAPEHGLPQPRRGRKPRGRVEEAAPEGEPKVPPISSETGARRDVYPEPAPASPARGASLSHGDGGRESGSVDARTRAATAPGLGQSKADAAAKPAAAKVPRLDHRRVRGYVEQFITSAKQWHPGDPQGQRLYLQVAVKRAAAEQGIELDDAAAGALLEELKVVVK